MQKKRIKFLYSLSYTLCTTLMFDSETDTCLMILQALIFFGETFLCLNWSIIADILLVGSCIMFLLNCLSKYMYIKFTCRIENL